MGHYIQVFISKAEILQVLTADLSSARTISLPQGFAMIPNTEELFDEITAGRESGPASEMSPFSELSVQLAGWAEHLSSFGPIAYIETEYFGGIGSQSAIVWDQGKIVLGPFKTDTEWSKNQGTAINVNSEDHAPVPLAESAINRALRYLGVYRGRATDEFDGLGLGRFRSIKEPG